MAHWIKEDWRLKKVLNEMALWKRGNKEGAFSV
jgi:hypothetical protein